MTARTKHLVSTALLGAFDGSNTGVSLILGLVAGASVSGMLKVAIPATMGGAASMAFGEWGSSSDSGWREALAMGMVWLTSCLMLIGTAVVCPAPWLWGAVGLELAGLGIMISVTRDAKLTRRGLERTYAILAVTGAVAAFTALLV